MRWKMWNVTWVVLVLIGAGATLGGASGSEQGSSSPGEPSPGVIDDRIVVGFSAGEPDWFAQWLEDRGGVPVLRDEVLDWVAVELPDAGVASQAVVELGDRPGLRYVEHERVHELQYIDEGVFEPPVSAVGGFVPDDPLYSSQWGYPAIQAPDGWAVQQGSHDVKVAVLDTGIMGTHPDLVDNICGPHRSFVPGEPPLEDWHFHGTHVSGTVAAVSDNGLGVAGTSQSCLMDVQVCTRWGSCPSSGSSSAIRWAADNGADIISMSWGGGGVSQAIQDAVEYAYAQDVLLIAAAGNSGCFGGNTVIYPAAYPEVVAVAALRSPGSDTAGFSSCGPEVEVAAPGAGVLSTNNNGGYRTASGTSMAAPHTSGVAALIKSEDPTLSAAELRCVLARTSDDILSLGPDIETGWGRVNAHAGITQGPPQPAPTGPPQLNPVQLAYLTANTCTPGVVV